tara:strand:- start:347 stop:853 length:507 start_codon:yes stop_codon:yes gene_type:complete
MQQMAKEYASIANQLQDFEKRMSTRDKDSEVPQCLRLVSRTLTRVRKHTVELESDMSATVQQPLLDLINSDIAAGKDQVRIYADQVREQEEMTEKLHKEIREQSTRNKADQAQVAKLLADSQKAEKHLEMQKSLTREMLEDVMVDCDNTIMDAFSGMIMSYHNYFQSG